MTWTGYVKMDNLTYTNPVARRWWQLSALLECLDSSRSRRDQESLNDSSHSRRGQRSLNDSSHNRRRDQESLNDSSVHILSILYIGLASSRKRSRTPYAGILLGISWIPIGYSQLPFSKFCPYTVTQLRSF
jgi:hypothetical protein